jgi:hypothetical protein
MQVREREREMGGERVGGFPFCLHVAHRIIMKLVLVFSRRTYYKYSLDPAKFA